MYLWKNVNPKWTLQSFIQFSGTKTQVMLAFSIYTNGMKLLSYEKTKSTDMMDCIHGIRAISTQWVVLGHSFMMFLLLPTRNKIEFTTVPNDQCVPFHIVSCFSNVLPFLFIVYSKISKYDPNVGPHCSRHILCIEWTFSVVFNAETSWKNVGLLFL